MGRWVAGTTLFLLITGFTIFFLPFSVFNQHAVVTHTLVGLLILVPTVLYTVRHLTAYWTFPFTHVKFSGWALALLLLVCSLSGVVLTWQGAFGTRITYLWQTLHIVTTFGVLLFLAAHLVPLWMRASGNSRDAAEEGFTAAMGGHAKILVGSTVGLLLATGAMTYVIRPVALINEFPDDYEADPYEGKGPFAPSLARTESGGAIDARVLSDSASCGTSRCHQEIYEEWLPSAHRYASLDVGFQWVQNVMADQNGAVSTRYCGGCHDPISLFSGTKNIGVEDLSSVIGYDEGISCMVCHAIKETDVMGNANYVMSQPERYVWELRGGKLNTFLADFLLRTYPQQHVDSLSKRMFKKPEFCAACHKQFVDEEVNQVGWVQLQNQYDNWKESRWRSEEHPDQTIECRECHMPLQASTDPAAGDDMDDTRSADDGMHRSHRFLGANQVIPVLAELEGWEEHVRLTEQWLRGEYEIPEIAHKWKEGPAVPIELDVPDQVEPGQSIEIAVRIINNKTGHDFPTGPLDIIQAWIELEVVDAKGTQVFHTGKLNEKNYIEEETFMFKAEPVDRYGKLIDRHNLWEMVGVRFKRSLFPGGEQLTNYTFDCVSSQGEMSEPPTGENIDVAVPLDMELTGPLTVRAKLNYRKFDQTLLDFAFPDSGLTAPITVLSTAEAEISLLPGTR